MSKDKKQKSTMRFVNKDLLNPIGRPGISAAGYELEFTEYDDGSAILFGELKISDCYRAITLDLASFEDNVAGLRADIEADIHKLATLSSIADNAIADLRKILNAIGGPEAGAWVYETGASDFHARVNKVIIDGPLEVRGPVTITHDDAKTEQTQKEL